MSDRDEKVMSLRVPRTVYEDLKEEAFLTRTTVSEIIRNAIDHRYEIDVDSSSLTAVASQRRVRHPVWHKNRSSEMGCGCEIGNDHTTLEYLKFKRSTQGSINE